jgi:hypothetical protein
MPILHSIDLNLPSSAAQNAANGLVLLHPTTASVWQNPAVSASGIESSISYLYNMSELPYYHLNAGYKIQNYQFNLGYLFLDHEFYRESAVLLSCGWRYQNLISAAALRYLRNEVIGFHSSSAYLIDLGILWQSKNVSSSLAIHNVSQSKFMDLPLPVFLLWETCYRISEKSSIAVGWEKQDGFDFSLKLAARYQPFPLLAVLAGYQNSPDRIGIGAVFQIKKISVTYSVLTHQYLDLTHFISVGYEIIP